MTVGSPGLLIVVEGGDGLGKSTQVRLLREQLESAGRQVMLLDFPSKSGNPIGRLIGEYLRGDHGEVSPEFLSLAFAADRLVSAPVISRHLNQSGTVLCDRFVRSNIAFQGSKISDQARRKRLGEMLEWLEYGVHRLVRPDLEIVLTAPPSFYTSGDYLKREIDATRNYVNDDADIHEGSFALQLAVNEYFCGLEESANLRKVDIYSGGIRRTKDDLRQAIWDCVSRFVYENLHKRGGSMTIASKIAGVWSAEDIGARAGELCRSLSPADAQRLFEIYREIEGSVNVGAEADRDLPLAQVSVHGLILLYAFGLEGADVLLYLPQDLRDAKIKQMAGDIGVSSDVVRRVAVLGSQEMARLLDAQ